MTIAVALVLGLAAAGASSGPDLSERATTVTLPVSRVMVFSDRAKVTRSGPTKWPESGVLKVPDLPGNVMLDSIRVTAEGARVLRVEKKPVDRERWSIDEVDAWMKELEEQGDKIALLNGKLATAQGSLSWLSGLEAAPPVLEKDRLGKPAPGLAPDNWRALQDKLGARRSVVRATQSKLEKELKDLYVAYNKTAREVSTRDLGGFSDRKIEVLVIVDPDAGKSSGALTLEYAVPGASWKPAYELYFDPDAKKVELRAAGVVSQATGEAWPDAKLALSTAIPSLGIAMPVLNTWTLGDDRQFVPYATPRAISRRPSAFAPPTPKARVAELEREADRQLLVTRSQQLLALASGAPSVVDDTGLATGAWFGSVALGDLVGGEVGDVNGMGGLGLRGTGSGGGGAGIGRPSVSPAMPRPARAPPPPPSEPMPMPAPPDDYQLDSLASERHSVSKSSGSRSRRTEGIFGGSADSDGEQDIAEGGGIEDDRGPSTTSRALALRSGIGWAKRTFSDPMLPAVTAGGFDYVYDAPITLTVPSQAQPMRVPLASRAYEVETFFEATPSLATTAFLKATVKNGSKLPILAGPATVFVNGTFSGDAQLQTTGPGGVLELPLGADENIRLTRTVVPSTMTQGFLIGEEDVTEYTVKIDIGNYKKTPVTIRVIDQLPKTNAEKMKIEIATATQKAEKPPDADGLMHWHISVPANGTKTLQWSYRIIRPKGWRLSQ